MSELQEIAGLHWEANWRIDNGQDSFVIPFPTTKPVNIVFHGEKRFDYGHYGIHLGQEDRLTFLGPQAQSITAHFIDTRENSPTRHKRLTVSFSPSSGRKLCIPPGVAHSFIGLETVFTINSYTLYLPDPELWLEGKTDWQVSNDVLNLPMDIDDLSLPAFVQNRHEASDVFYQLIADYQREAIPKLAHEYPYTEDIHFDNGDFHRLLFRKRLQDQQEQVDFETIPGIEGLGWEKHLVVKSGEESGFVPLLDFGGFYVVDHGEKEYTHDAFGIHKSQQDRLTFLGPPGQKVNVTLVRL